MGKGKHGHTGEHGKSHGHGKGGSESHKDGHGHKNNHSHPTAATTSTSNEGYLQSPDPTIINTSPQGSITSVTNRRGKPSRMTQKIEERRLVDSPPDKMSNFVQSLRGLNSGTNRHYELIRVHKHTHKHTHKHKYIHTFIHAYGLWLYLHLFCIFRP